jgi:predicted transposase YdaD
VTAKAFDPTTKALVENGPDDWPVLIGQPAAPTEVIDADIATVSGAADKVLRVQAADPYLLHLEFQCGHDSADLPKDLHMRNALLEHRHDLPVRSVVVLLRPEADSRTLTGIRERAFPGERPYTWFKYQVVRIWRLPPAALLAGGLGTLPLAPVSAVTEAEVPGIIEKMKRRLATRRLRGKTKEVWAATYILLGLRYSRERAHELLRGVVSMKESVTYQAILEEGEARGEARGRKEGEAQGVLKEARRMVCVVGEKYIGPPDSDAVVTLERIDNVSQLEALCARAPEVASWQELLDPPTRRRGNGRPRRTPE